MKTLSKIRTTVHWKSQLRYNIVNILNL